LSFLLVGIVCLPASKVRMETIKDKGVNKKKENKSPHQPISGCQLFGGGSKPNAGRLNARKVALTISLQDSEKRWNAKVSASWAD